MATAQRHEITGLLLAWRNGDEAALEKLAPLVEAELRRRAERYLRRERLAHTLQPTALVNEVYLRLFEWRKVDWKNRAQFMGVAANMMRRILVDYARHRQYLKRGGGAIEVCADGLEIISPEPQLDLVALDDALTGLAALDARKALLVELRFFGGLSVDETAEVMKIGPRTVKREWSLARAWLHCELTGGQKHDA
jgi:RNA polymerase sigma-70 factor (ECF subfamily)